MTKPVLSVIVPVYKAEATLERCVNSILAQTLSDLELLLVDDGSPDRSGELCELLAKKDSRIRVFHKGNGGAASARNYGIDRACGQYFGFVDSDDYIDPEMYGTMLQVMQEHDLPMLDSGRYNVRGDQISPKEQTGELRILSGEEALGGILDWTGSCSLCTRLFRREVFDRGLRLPEGRRVEDFYFCAMLFHELKQEAYYDRCFYYVVENAQSVTRSGGGSIFLDALYYAEKLENLVKTQYPGLLPKLGFFRFYSIGQLFLNAKPEEHKRYKEDFCRYARYLRRHMFTFMRHPLLRMKYRLVLFLACLNRRLPMWLYSGKK